MAAFQTAPSSSVLPQKRTADGAPAAAPLCVSTLHIRPGAPAVVASGAKSGAAALNLRLNTSAAKPNAPGAKAQTQDEEGGPTCVEASGFESQELNVQYSARPEVVMHGRRTYWSAPEAAADDSLPPVRRFFCWQAALGRWTLCEWVGPGSDQLALDAEVLEKCVWRAFQLDDRPNSVSWTGARLVEPGVWVEQTSSGWVRAEAVRLAPAAPQPMVALRPNPAEQQPQEVDFTGFRRLELNSRYKQRTDLVVQGKPSFWDLSGSFFIYWQSGMRRWAICGKAQLDSVRKGQCPGCACQLDPVHFASPCRWVEYTEGTWISVPVEVTVQGLPEGEAAKEEGVA